MVVNVYSSLDSALEGSSLYLAKTEIISERVAQVSSVWVEVTVFENLVMQGQENLG